MKSLLRKTLVLVLFCTVHFAVNAQSVGTVVGSGSCGTSVQYQLIVNSNYMNDPNSYTGLTLRIYGTGAMADYTTTSMPWYDKRLSITKVIVEEGVTSVGKYMCDKHFNLLDAHLPSTLTKIGTYAFDECDKMTVINIPENVTTIESSVFSGTSRLNVIFESTNPSWTIPSNFIPSRSGYKMYIPSGTKSFYQGKLSTYYADANVIEGTPYFCTFAVPEGLCDLPYQDALFYENKVRTLALPVRKSDGTTTTWDIEVIPQPKYNSESISHDYARYGYQQPNEFAFMADSEGHKYTDADGDNKLHINVRKNTELEPHFNFTVGPVTSIKVVTEPEIEDNGLFIDTILPGTYYSEGTLVSNVNTQFHYNKLIHKIFGGESSGEFYFDNFTSAISFDTMVVENVIDGSKWYYFSFPFDCEWDDLKVTSVDGSIDYSSVYPETERYDSPYRWIILGFDPVKFASGLQGMDAYTFVESGTTLKKGIVYAVGVIGGDTDSLKFAGASTDFHSIKKQQDLEVSLTYAESTLENLITDDDDIPLLSRAGWNLVSFPFPMNVNTSQGANNVYTYALHMDFGRHFYSIYTWANDEEYGSGNEVWYEYPDEDEDGVFFERQGPGMMLFAQVDENEASGNFTSVWTKETRAAAPKAKSEIIEISIAQDTNVYDKVYISNKESASSAYVIKEDCYKMENAGKAQIYTFTTDSAPCVFNEQNLAEERIVIPFGMNIPKAGNYTFSLNTDRYMGPLAVLNLHDLSNDSRINLMNGPVEISLGAGRSNDRYELEIEYLPAAILPVENTGSAVAYTTDDMLHVENIAEGSMVSVYDASGRMVMTESGSERIDCQLPSRGVYMVVVRGEENSTIKVVY